MNKTNNRGGARIGAGAPIKQDKGTNRTVRLSDQHYDKYKRLGGAKWLRNTIEDAPEPNQQ